MSDVGAHDLVVAGFWSAVPYRVGRKEKRLSLGVYPDVSLRAARARQASADYLVQLAHLEVTGRREHRIQRCIQDARFPMLKTVDAFSFDAQPRLGRGAVLQVFGCSFVAEAANVVLVGGVGTGEAHLAIALGIACCEHDYRVRFLTADELVTLLVQAQQQGRLTRKLDQCHLRPQFLCGHYRGRNSRNRVTDVAGACRQPPRHKRPARPPPSDRLGFATTRSPTPTAVRIAGHPATDPHVENTPPPMNMPVVAIGILQLPRKLMQRRITQCSLAPNKPNQLLIRPSQVLSEQIPSNIRH